MDVIDARGLSCPEPVVLTRDALRSSPTQLTVLVDAVAAKENVTRFAMSQGYAVEATEKGGSTTLILTR